MPSSTLIGKKVTVAGWGNTIGGIYSLSPILKHVTIPVVPPSVCEATYAGQLYDSGLQICAGDLLHQQGSCQGDSGRNLIFYLLKKAIRLS